MYVTGLSVSDFRPRAPREWKRRLRQELYYIEKFGLHGHLGRSGYSSIQSGVNQIGGKISFLRSVEPMLAANLQSKWELLLAKEGASEIYVSRKDTEPRSVDIFIDESERSIKDVRILMLCCVITEDADHHREFLNDLHSSLLADPYIPGRKKVLQKRGLHWTDISEEIRGRLVDQVTLLPIRAYVAFSLIQSESNYSKIYYQLLRSLLETRYIALDAAGVRITAEENTKVSVSKLQSISDEIYDGFQQSNARRPRVKPTVAFGRKHKEPCLALPDCLLGVLGDYTGKTSKSAGAIETSTVRFEKLRNKYRLIAYYSGSTRRRVFSRRRPLEPWDVAPPWEDS